MEKEIMTTVHPKWEEFTSKLDNELQNYDCSGQMDRILAIKVLVEIGNIDISATLEYFNKNGGFCDCEILLNVDKE